MIYFILFFVIAIITDFSYLKNTNNKGNIVFYVSFMLVALGFGIFYYINIEYTGISEIVLTLFNLEVK